MTFPTTRQFNVPSFSFSHIWSTAAKLGRWLMLGSLAVAFWLGGWGFYSPSAWAEADEAGPIRQTHSPLSQENFQGGVDRSAIDPAAISSDNNPSQSQSDSIGLVDRIKTLVPGLADEDENSPRSDSQPEKNPTLSRYTTQN